MYKELTGLISDYTTSFPEEEIFIEKFEQLLAHPNAFNRDHLPGHITGSAWVVNQARTKVLLHQHVKLQKWLQPGGHADGDRNVLAVALRELEEETGLKNIRQLGIGVFDLDIHLIPARKDFPQHDHYDVRFCFEADEREPITVSDESLDVRWISIVELKLLTDSKSLFRMAEKLFKL